MIESEKLRIITEWLGDGSVNFFGMPFAGKDSQAKRICAHFNGIVLGGGDILRNSPIPAGIQEIMNSGELIPTDEYVKIVLPYLSQESFNGKPLFLSAVGRWEGEEVSVLAALESAEHPLRMVVYLKIDIEEAKRRLASEDIREHRGDRIDDDLQTLIRRMDEFQAKTLPVIEHYRELGYLVEIDASLPKDEVERQILEEMAVRAGTLQDA